MGRRRGLGPFDAALADDLIAYAQRIINVVPV
jgi:hypothetical protein